MKKLLIGLIVFTSFGAIAGTPAQDPIVKNMMERFAKAGRLQADHLLKSTYSCFAYRALKDYFNKGRDHSKFSFFNPRWICGFTWFLKLNVF